MDTALNTAINRPDLTWHMSTGPNLSEQQFDLLNARCPDHVKLVRYISNLANQMKLAKVSISQCGYNTAMDVLAAHKESPCRAVFVPYDTEGQSEQIRRAQLLEEAGYAVNLPQSKLTAEGLSQAIDQAMGLPNVALAVDFDGVDNTARLLRFLARAPMSKIAFYATIKPPDHPIASGDRLIARSLIAALKIAGYDVELASSFIAYSKREAKEILLQRKADAHGEAEAIVERLKPSPPDLWITYHPYCKAPDWIGPIVSAALGIPYVTIEAARTGQGFEDGGDRWAHWRQEAQTGIRKADLHLAFKPTDQAFLTELLGTR